MPSHSSSADSGTSGDGTRPLVIGIDASFLARDRRGMGRFLRNVLDQWEGKTHHRLILLCQHRRHLVGLEDYQKRGWEVALAPHSPALDVCWFPWNRVDWETKCPRVVFIHDVAPFTPYHPDRHREEDQQRLFEAAERADLVMTNSNFSRIELHRYLGCSLEDIEVVYLAHDEAMFSPLPGGLPTPSLPGELSWMGYLLYIGNLEPRKNLRGLLEAMVLARKDVHLPLALVSPKPSLHWTEKLRGRQDCLVSLAESLEDRLIWLDPPDDKELVNLYRGARLFVMPSFYEGFGFPLLEAMACGTPCISAKAASLPEVGGPIPIWFNPKDPVDIARALMEGLRRAPTEWAEPAVVREQLENFSWRRSAEHILECLVSTALRPPRRAVESSFDLLAAVGEDEREAYLG